MCWDAKDILRGKPTGACRVSVGYSTTWEDIYGFVEFIRRYFTNNKINNNTTTTTINTTTSNNNTTTSEGLLSLENIYVYPIKSCGRFETDQWEITDHGK